MNISWKSLHNADLSLTVPFELNLSDIDAPILCEQLIQMRLKERLIAFGKWNNQEVVIKLFYHSKSSKKDIRSELNGISILEDAKIRTPKLLYVGSADNNQIHVLLFEKINNAKTIDDNWQKQKTLPSNELDIDRVLKEIATQHSLGILQRDLNPKNFLIVPNCIYSIDGAKISKFKNPIDKQDSFKYLASFILQLRISSEESIQELVEIYMKFRNWMFTLNDWELFLQILQCRRRDRWSRYKNKCLRYAADFTQRKTGSYAITSINEIHSMELTHLLSDPEALLNQASTIFLKREANQIVAKVFLNNQTLLFKGFYYKSLWSKIHAFFLGTKADKSWQLACCLYGLKMFTTKPLAYVIKHRLGVQQAAYVVMDYTNGLPVDDYFQANQGNTEVLKHITQQINYFIKSLTDLNIILNDLKASTLIANDKRLVLVDWDYLQERK